jgi:hypothetical protein
MITKLLGPQQEHAYTLLDSIYLNGYAIDKSPTGTGKTYVASAIAAEMQVPVVVVCPKVVIPTWKKILGQFGISNPLVINYEKLSRGNTQWVKFDKKKFLKKKAWESDGITVNFPSHSLIIMDEAHKCRGYRSIAGDLLIAIANGGYKVLLATATLATTVLELRASGYLTGLHNGENFSKFCRDHGAKYNSFGGMIVDFTEESVKGIQKIHSHLFDVQKSASRMDLDDFNGIFPENHVVAEAFDMGTNTAKINAVYSEMERELDLLDKRSVNYRDHVFAIIMKARRHAELLKVPSLVETVEDWFDEGISPVVFLNFTDSIEALENRLKQNPKLSGLIGKIVGGQSDAVRNKDIEDFNADRKRIMLVNMAAGNAGVSLHDLNGKHPRNSMLIPSFSAINLLQALGRIPRQGGLTICFQRIIFSAGTIEESACQRVQGRIDNLSTLNDGDLMGSLDIYR